ncbi:MAG: hypothetical protein HQL95_13425 [Magnetococcales bacterium]|nr:hypothetical protein [Magnetococcales bacterium]
MFLLQHPVAKVPHHGCDGLYRFFPSHVKQKIKNPSILFTACASSGQGLSFSTLVPDCPPACQLLMQQQGQFFMQGFLKFLSINFNHLLSVVWFWTHCHVFATVAGGVCGVT